MYAGFGISIALTPLPAAVLGSSMLYFTLDVAASSEAVNTRCNPTSTACTTIDWLRDVVTIKLVHRRATRYANLTMSQKYLVRYMPITLICFRLHILKNAVYGEKCICSAWLRGSLSPDYVDISSLHTLCSACYQNAEPSQDFRIVH